MRVLCLLLCVFVVTSTGAAAGTYTARIRWQPSAGAGVIGYRLYVRAADAGYGAGHDVGLPPAGPDGMLSALVGDRDVRTDYVFAVSALGEEGESALSNELTLGYAQVAPFVDSDGDGLSDAEEDQNLNRLVDPGETDPEDPDTDGDGINDDQDKCPAAKGPKARNGCPEEVKKEIVEKVNFAARRIGFAQSKANLLPASLKVLDDVASILKKNPAIHVAIEGHTSGDAGYDANMKLSQDRADKVKAYLILKGISSSRLTAEGFGPNKPLTKGISEAEKAKNRRVELRLSNQ